MDEVYGTLCDDPDNKALQKKYDSLQAQIYAAGDYRALAELGPMQAADLRALDFWTSVGSRMRVYNVRAAKTGWNNEHGCHCKCGLAYTNKMWHHVGTAGSSSVSSTGCRW